MGRPKGLKNKKSLEIKSYSLFVRLEESLRGWMSTKTNKSEYISYLIRKDMEEQINNQE